MTPEALRPPQHRLDRRAPPCPFPALSSIAKPTRALPRANCSGHNRVSVCPFFPILNLQGTEDRRPPCAVGLGWQEGFRYDGGPLSSPFAGRTTGKSSPSRRRSFP